MLNRTSAENIDHVPRRLQKLLAALVVAVCLPPSTASADWLIAPFVGSTFAGRTAFLTFEHGDGDKQLVFGGSAGWLTDGLVGFEAEFAYAPRFYERDNRSGLVTDSYLWTLSGNVIITVPLSVTRESLRPYVVGGLGVINGRSEDVVNVFPELQEQQRALAAFNVGAGVIGAVTRNAGVRFDLRHMRSLSRGQNPVTLVSQTKLSFWRVTAGVTLQY